MLIGKKIPCIQKIAVEFWPSGLCSAIAQPLLVNPHIKTLLLDRCRIDDEATEILADILRQPQCSLERLLVPRNYIRDCGCAVLMDALPNNSSLRELDLSWNMIGLEGSRAIARGLKDQSVTLGELNLAYNDCGDEGYICIADALKENSTSRKLHLGCCDAVDNRRHPMPQHKYLILLRRLLDEENCSEYDYY